MALQIRRGLEADRVFITPAQGELLYTTDEKKLYIGDGTTAGGFLVAGGQDTVQDIVGSQFDHNFHNSISFEYDVPSGRIIATVPGINIAATDSTVRNVKLGETIQFIGTGGSTVTSDAEGNITIDSLTYNVSAETAIGGAALRLSSLLSLDEVKFVGSGGTTVTRTDANTITISGGGGGGGSGDVNAGLANQIAYYAASGTQVSGTVSLTWDEATQTLSTSFLDANTIVTNNSTFSIFNTNNQIISLGGTLGGIEYSGRLNTVDLAFDPTTGIGHRFLSSHNSFFTNLATFIRQRGTIAAPQKIIAGDIIGGIGFVGYDGAGFKGLGNITVASATTPVTGSGVIPGIMVFQTANNSGNVANALWLNQNQGAEFFGDVTLAKSISNGTLKIQNNVIESIVSNSNIELRTSGTGAIYLDNISVNVGVIDTLDSTGITFAPEVTFQSDVNVENDLRVSNKIYATEFVSTDTSPPEIVVSQNLDITVVNKSWTYRSDGGYSMPVLSSAPASPTTSTIYVANGTTWDPASKAGSTPYPVFYDGVAYNALF